jgi:hypothetical protein
MSDVEKICIEHDFKLDDIVWLYNRIIKHGQVKKFTFSWHGPFKIHCFFRPITVIFMNKARKTLRELIYASYLKFYKSSNNHRKSAK